MTARLLSVLLALAVLVAGAAGVSSAASSDLRACRSFVEHNGPYRPYRIQIRVRNVSCRTGRGQYNVLHRALRAGLLNESAIEPRPGGAYGYFGRRFKLGGFTCHLAAIGLARAEFKLRCTRSPHRTIEIQRG